VPVDSVVPAGWRELVIEADGRGHKRITRSVLQRLREKVRWKEIWMAAAGRHRNPG
jgi:hypothetical protein